MSVTFRWILASALILIILAIHPSAWAQSARSPGCASGVAGYLGARALYHRTRPGRAARRRSCPGWTLSCPSRSGRPCPFGFSPIREPPSVPTCFGRLPANRRRFSSIPLRAPNGIKSMWAPIGRPCISLMRKRASGWKAGRGTARSINQPAATCSRPGSKAARSMAARSSTGIFEGGNRFGPQGNIFEHLQGWFDVAARSIWNSRRFPTMPRSFWWTAKRWSNGRDSTICVRAWRPAPGSGRSAGGASSFGLLQCLCAHRTMAEHPSPVLSGGEGRTPWSNGPCSGRTTVFFGPSAYRPCGL